MDQADRGNRGIGKSGELGESVDDSMKSRCAFTHLI